MQTDARKTTKPTKDVTTARQQRMIALLQRENGTTAAELIEAAGTSKQNVYKWLHSVAAVRDAGRWYLRKGTS